MSTPKVRCPGCGTELPYDPHSPFRPFCSERCRVKDFTGWANERYRIPEQTPPDGTADEPHPEDGR
ncbi:MAG: DNA gyrase inhibitor YacG [Pseudomonadota bacterium]